MSNNEEKRTASQQSDAEIRQYNQESLDSHLRQYNFLVEDMYMCFETSLRLLRCANLALMSEGISDENAAAIGEVTGLAETIIHIDHARHMLS